MVLLRVRLSDEHSRRERRRNSKQWNRVSGWPLVVTGAITASWCAWKARRNEQGVASSGVDRPLSINTRRCKLRRRRQLFVSRASVLHCSCYRHSTPQRATHQPHAETARAALSSRKRDDVASRAFIRRRTLGPGLPHFDVGGVFFVSVGHRVDGFGVDRVVAVGIGKHSGWHVPPCQTGQFQASTSWRRTTTGDERSAAKTQPQNCEFVVYSWVTADDSPTNHFAASQFEEGHQRRIQKFS